MSLFFSLVCANSLRRDRRTACRLGGGLTTNGVLGVMVADPELGAAGESSLGVSTTVAGVSLSLPSAPASAELTAGVSTGAGAIAACLGDGIGRLSIASPT